jgi:hypothetical protein
VTTPDKQQKRGHKRVPRQGRRVPVHVVMRRRGGACLGAAGLVTMFLTCAMLGAGGGWSPWHTGLALTVAGSAMAALACYVAATLRTPKQTVLAQPVALPASSDSPVTHPGVSHLRPVPVLTAPGQEK